MKKAQVTFFIILGLTILLVFIYYFIAMYQRPDFEVQSPIDFYMKSCMEMASEDAFYRMGLYTGNIQGPTRELIPDLEITEQLLKEHLVEQVLVCVDNYPNDEALQITAGEPQIDITFGEGITIRLDNMFSYGRDDSLTQSVPQVFQFKIRYKLLRETALDIQQYTDYIPDSAVQILKEIGEMW